MRLYEIIGSVALLATLFASVGFSGWTYGSNLIQNGNFSEIRWSYGNNLLPNPNFTDNITGWDGDGVSWVNNSGNGIANLTDYLLSIPYGSYGDIYIGEYYYWSFLFKTDNASNLIQANMDGGADVFINTTTICDNNPEYYPEEGCIFPSANYLEDATHITSQGDDWYKFETIFFATTGGGLVDCYIDPEPPTSVQVDNVVVMNLTQLPADWHQIDWSDCQTEADIPTWNGSYLQYSVGNYVNVSGSEAFGDVELADYPVLLDKNKIYYLSLDYNYEGYGMAIYFVQNTTTCDNAMPSIIEWNDTTVQEWSGLYGWDITSLGGGWSRMSGYLNLSTLYEDSLYSRLIFGWSLYGSYLLDNIVLEEATYTAPPCQGWQCATTARAVVGLTPIVVGLGLLAGMVGMFLMRDEEDSMIVLVMRGGVIALISVVMLGILASIIG